MLQMLRSERVALKTTQAAPLRAVEDGFDASRSLRGFWGLLIQSW